MTHPHNPYTDPERNATIILIIAFVFSLLIAMHEILK